MRANLDLLTYVSPWYRIIFNILNEIFPQDPDRAAAPGDLASQREDGAGPAESGRDQQAEAAGGGPGQTWQVNTLSHQSYGQICTIFTFLNFYWPSKWKFTYTSIDAVQFQL